MEDHQDGLEELHALHREKVDSYLSHLNWTNETVTQKKVEPSAAQIMKENYWVTARWMSDLLRNDDYSPSLGVVKATITRNLGILSDKDDLAQQLGIDEDNPAPARELKTVENRYKQSLKVLENHTYFNYDTVVNRFEDHPLFPIGLHDMDDHNSFQAITSEFAHRLSGTETGGMIAEWMMDHLDLFVEVSDPEEAHSFVIQMTEFAGKPSAYNEKFYDKLAHFISTETLEEVTLSDGEPDDYDYVEWEDQMYVFYTASGKRVQMEYADRWDTMYTIFARERSNVLDGLITAIARQESIEARNRALATVFGEKGPAEVLNYIRTVVNDESLPQAQRQDASRLFRSFYEGVVITHENQEIPADIVHFYDLVADKEDYMTEKREGNTREQFLVSLFETEKLGDKLIVDVACGTGWLTDRLANNGYNVLGVDVNERLIKKAQERFPNRKYYVAPWEDMSNVEGIDKAKVYVINGRSIHHASQFPGVHELMHEMKDAEMIVFDGMNPLTGGQLNRLDNFRSALSNFGFSDEWLRQYMWQGVGSHDGVTLGDRWYPPVEWWKNIVGMYGYSVETHTEHDYDGSGADNIVYVCKKIQDPEERDNAIRKSYDYFEEIMEQQPTNPNGYAIRNWYRPNSS